MKLVKVPSQVREKYRKERVLTTVLWLVLTNTRVPSLSSSSRFQRAVLDFLFYTSSSLVNDVSLETQSTARVFFLSSTWLSIGSTFPPTNPCV